MRLCFKLVPTSPMAATLAQGSDIYLPTSLRFGRSVARPDGITLPGEWIQFSGNHCRVYCSSGQGDVQWFVEDTSTNGTFVNDVRVPKGGSLPFKEGDRLRLSSNPNEILEFELVRELPVEERGDNYSMANVGIGMQHNKRKVSELTEDGDTAALKYMRRSAGPGALAPGGHPMLATVQRPRSPPAGSTGAGLDAMGGAGGDLLKNMAQLEKTNQELRRRLEATRREAEDATRQQLLAQQQHSEQVRALEARLQETERKALSRDSAASEAAATEMRVAKLRASEAEAQLANLEARLAAEASARAAADRIAGEAKAQLEAARGEVARAEADALSLRAAVATLREEKDALERRLKDEAAARLAAQEASQRTALQLQAEAQAASAARRLVEEADRNARAALAQVDEERKARRSAEEELMSTRSQLDDARRRLDSLEERLTSKHDRLVMQRAQLRSLAANHSHAVQIGETLMNMLSAIGRQYTETIADGDTMVGDMTQLDMLDRPTATLGLHMTQQQLLQLQRANQGFDLAPPPGCGGAPGSTPLPAALATALTTTPGLLQRLASAAVPLTADGPGGTAAATGSGLALSLQLHPQQLEQGLSAAANGLAPHQLLPGLTPLQAGSMAADLLEGPAGGTTTEAAGAGTQGLEHTAVLQPLQSTQGAATQGVVPSAAANGVLAPVGGLATAPVSAAPTPLVARQGPAGAEEPQVEVQEFEMATQHSEGVHVASVQAGTAQQQGSGLAAGLNDNGLPLPLPATAAATPIRGMDGASREPNGAERMQTEGLPDATPDQPQAAAATGDASAPPSASKQQQQHIGQPLTHGPAAPAPSGTASTSRGRAAGWPGLFSSMLNLPPAGQPAGAAGASPVRGTASGTANGTGTPVQRQALPMPQLESDSDMDVGATDDDHTRNLATVLSARKGVRGTATATTTNSTSGSDDEEGERADAHGADPAAAYAAGVGGLMQRAGSSRPHSQELPALADVGNQMYAHAALHGSAGGGAGGPGLGGSAGPYSLKGFAEGQRIDTLAAYGGAGMEGARGPYAGEAHGTGAENDADME